MIWTVRLAEYAVAAAQRGDGARSGGDEQAGEVHDGYAGGQPAHDGRVEQAAGVIPQRGRDLGDDLNDRADADTEQHSGQWSVVHGRADDRAENRGNSGDGA